MWPNGQAPARIGACWEFRPRRDLAWSTSRNDWLTRELVLGSMARLSSDAEKFEAERDWYAEQLDAPAYPLTPEAPGSPAGPESTGKAGPVANDGPPQLPEAENDD